MGDKIFFKLPGKPATASAWAKDVKFFELSPKLADDIKKKFGKEIGIDKFQNWEEVRTKKYLTLIWLDDIEIIPPRHFDKKGRAGWVVINKPKTITL